MASKIESLPGDTPDPSVGPCQAHVVEVIIHPNQL